MDYEPEKIIIDNEAAIWMVNYNKDIVKNRHIVHLCHYIRQGIASRNRYIK